MAELRQWDGTQWITVTDEAHRADAGDPHPQYVLETQNTVDALLDADTTTVPPVTGDGLVWNGTNWIPGAPVSQGITPLAATRLATTGQTTLTGTIVVDGVQTVAGDRVLVKSQTNAVENGVYDVVASAAWTRSADVAAEGDLIVGNSVLVQEGNVNGGISFLVALESADLPWTPGTDEDRWYAAISKLDLQAGAGMSVAGNILNVGQGQGILVGADDVALDTTFTDARYAPAAFTVAMDDLTDADTTTLAPVANDILSWNGTQWVPSTPAAGATLPAAGAGLTGGAATYDVGAGTGITVAADTVSLDKAYTDTLYSPVAHVHALDDLSDADTTTTAPVLNNVLTYNGSVWAPAAPAPGGVDELKELLDVDVLTTPPIDRDSLIYNFATSKWVPGTVSSGGVTDHGALTGLTDNDHPQYPQWAISNIAPAAPTTGQFWTVIP